MNSRAAPHANANDFIFSSISSAVGIRHGGCPAKLHLGSALGRLTMESAEEPLKKN